MSAVHRSFGDRFGVFAGGLALLLAYLWLFPLQRPGLESAFAGYLVVTGLAAAIIALLARAQQRAPGFLNLGGLLFWALAFRLAALSAAPLMEDDPYRYLWDGWVTLSLGSPYGVAPASFFDSALVPEDWESVLDAVAYPAVPTAYGPTAQGLFALSAQLFATSSWPLQCLALAGDLAILGLLLCLVPARQRPWVALLYGWCPLVIKEFANSAHIDSVGVALLLAALALTHRARGVPSGALLALAVGVKPFALLAAPFLLANQRARGAIAALRWPAALASLMTFALIAWPLGLDRALAPAGLAAMAGSWVFNAPLHEAVLRCCGATARQGVGLALLLGVGAFLMFAWWRWLRAADDLRAPGRWPLLEVFGLFLLALPALNPWYLIWVLPFALLRPGPAAASPWVAAVALALSYGSGINLPGSELGLYEHPRWVLGLEFAAIYAAVALDLYRWQRFAR